ncbi:hypothetical protein GCM10010103_75050 [Streptomyces paradoxus]|uniref:Uncharacterized protein n=1 Tax=Streptomyces paradoxus TaxID=66375 RepID=A0A7W9WMI7_9ACTN|nr:hypothetical protein [Streptomyces paradoxus]MBB6081725.1 hypothetical protein [Streptomyces paradoxus]
MLQDPYAVMRALLRAEAARSAPKSPSRPDTRKPPQPLDGQRRGQGRDRG